LFYMINEFHKDHVVDLKMPKSITESGDIFISNSLLLNMSVMVLMNRTMLNTISILLSGSLRIQRDHHYKLL